MIKVFDKYIGKVNKVTLNSIEFGKQLFWASENFKKLHTG